MSNKRLNRTIQAVALLACWASARAATPIQPGNLLIPNSGLAAIQEFDPVTRAIVQTLPLPAGYTYASPYQAHGALVRTADHVILTNARSSSGVPTVLALSDTGVLISAQSITQSYLQQIAFDPLDTTESTVLGGAPFSPSVLAVNPFAHSVSTRLTITGGNLIGLFVDDLNRLFVGDFATGKITLFDANGNNLGLFANVQAASGAAEINAMVDDDLGNVYVAQNNYNRVLKFGPSGIYLGALSVPSFNRPAYLSFNPNDGLLYVGNVADDRLVIMTTAGAEVAAIHLGGGFIGVPGLVPGSIPPPAGLRGCLTSNGAPLAGLPVVLRQPGGTKFQSTTDASGCYAFDQAVSGEPFRLQIRGSVP